MVHCIVIKINTGKAFFSILVLNIVFSSVFSAKYRFLEQVKANKAIFFGLVFLVWVCACVPNINVKRSNAIEKGQIDSEEPQKTIKKMSVSCPENISGEDWYCQIFHRTKNKANTSIDVLWVIDNSESMCEHQERLAKNFDSFLKQFTGQSQNTDFRMAFISSPYGNRSEKGCLSTSSSDSIFRQTGDFGDRMYYVQCGETLSTSKANLEKKDFINQFKSRIREIGCNGMSYYAESGLVMSLDFLEENPKWARADAFFLVIHLSDEYDASGLLEYQSNSKLIHNNLCNLNVNSCSKTGGDGDLDHRAVANYYIDTLDTHKNSKFKVFSIVSKKPDAPRFNQVAKLSDGKSYDILKDSFDTILQDFGEQVAKISSSLQLKYPVQTGSVEVFIDGVPAAQGDWRYLEDQNAIRFEDGVFKGKKGEVTIKVTYRTK